MTTQQMTAFYYGVELLSNSIEVFMILYFSEHLLKPKYCGRKRIITFIVSAVMIFTVSTIIQTINLSYIPSHYSFLLDVIMICLYIIYSVLFTSKKLLIRIVIPAMECSAVMLISLCVNIVVSKITEQQAESLLLVESEQRILSLILIKVLFYLFMRLFEKHFRTTDVQFQEYETAILSILSTVSLILCSLLVQFRMYYATLENIDMICFIGIFFLILIDVFVMVITKILIRKNGEIIDLIIYKNNYQSIREQEESFYQLKESIHNHKHVIMALRSMLEKKDYEGIEAYIDSEHVRFKDNPRHISTGNLTLDTILNNKRSIAIKNGISFTVNISMPEEVVISDLDLANVLGNLLDNAIEALDTQAEKNLHIQISEKKGFLFIKIVNTYSLTNTIPASHPKDKKIHGIGIKSVERILQSYDGNLILKQENEKFIATAALPLK